MAEVAYANERQDETKAADPRGCDATSDGSSEMERDLRNKLHSRRHQLHHEMNEIEEALAALSTDASVKRVLRILSIAKVSPRGY